MTDFGKVLWFGGYNSKTEKINDFGYIETSNGTSYRVHESAVQAGTALNKGLWVEFIPEQKQTKGKAKKVALEVKAITPHPDFPFETLLGSADLELIQFVVAQALKEEEMKPYAREWFQQWLEYQTNKDPECKYSYFTGNIGGYSTNFHKNLAELVKDTHWKEHHPHWGLQFYRKLSEYNVQTESPKRIDAVNTWIEQQSIDFLLKQLNNLPKWLQEWDYLLQRFKEWLSQLPVKEQLKYKGNIPGSLKEKLNLWYLNDWEAFNVSFAKHWNSIKNDPILREECLEHWLQCYLPLGGWEEPLTGSLENWALKREKHKMPFPLNWKVDSYYVRIPYLSHFAENPVKLKIPLSEIWRNIPSSFFEFLSVKVQKKEIDFDIPIEAWALYLRGEKPTERSISWIKYKWKNLHQNQKLTIFSLLGENWFHCYRLHPDLGSSEALLLWEDMNGLDLSKKGFWWDQLDIMGKCTWYILAFQKGYRNEAFLEEDVSHPLLKSFQLLYKHYLGIQSLHFGQWHSLLQDYYIGLAKNFDEKSLKSSTWLWPGCDHNKCNYCEGKPWRQGNEAVHQINRAYCPRTKKECSLAFREDDKGARFRSYRKRPDHWLYWRMPEIIEYLKITVPVEIVKNPYEYVTRFGGWLNRLIELQERLKCRGCHEPMKNNFDYSKDFFARYSMTIATCHHHSPGHHDKDIYFNDCWNRDECHQMIDSRDNPQRDMRDRSINPRLGTYRNFYLCTDCGAAKDPRFYPGYLGWSKEHKSTWDLPNLRHTHFKKWYYVPGDKCTQCGSENMRRHSKGNESDKTHATCNNCSHTIRIPRVFLPVIDLWEEHKQTSGYGQ